MHKQFVLMLVLQYVSTGFGKEFSFYVNLNEFRFIFISDS